MTENMPPSFDSAYAQAKKYGEDLAKLYAIEKAKRETLQLSNQKLQAIFSTTPDGLAVLDNNLNIEEANPAFWTMLERPQPDLPVAISTVLPFEALQQRLQTSSAGKNGHSSLEIELSLTETSMRTLLINTVPLSAGHKRGWVISVHDLTERKRLESLKSEFINIAAHELRTPLAAILGFSQVLKENLEESNDELSAHLIDTILSSSNRLKDIIDELIEFADIRYQKESPQNATTFNLITSVEETIAAIARSAQDKNLTIETEFDRDILEFTGNHGIIREVLKHLAENAVLFNKPGEKIIFRVSEKAALALLEIEDTGIGIPQQDLDKIFDKFYQVEEHLTRSVGGLGLGLAIAQRGVQLHGGIITVKSQLNHGSCFMITMPTTQPTHNTTSLDEGLKDVYKQTLAYGRDLAKAVNAEHILTVKLKNLEETRQELQQAIDNNAPKAEIEAIVKRMAVDQ